jgi:exodeoxyribonuclease VII small subunit
MDTMPKKEEPRPPAFEAGLEELETVVRKLESGDLPLEESLTVFEHGVQLSERCRQQLTAAETRVEILLKKGDKVTPAPFEDHDA